MMRVMCKSKLHGLRVTGANLNYAGSIGLDKTLAKAAGILEFEAVQVLNLYNGERFTTYVVFEKEGSGSVFLYGPAARKGLEGDLLIVLTMALFEEKDLNGFKPAVVYVDSQNKIIKK